MARYKGFLETAVKGVAAVERLKDGDTVLIAEGCTHHRQCDDIGSVKIPRWLKNYTGKALNFKTASGTEFPEDLTGYALIIHCGGCMLNEREVLYQNEMRRRPECTRHKLWHHNRLHAGNSENEALPFFHTYWLKSRIDHAYRKRRSGRYGAAGRRALRNKHRKSR